MGARAPWRGESQGVYRYQVSVEKSHGETQKRDSLIAMNQVLWEDGSLEDMLVPARAG